MERNEKYNPDSRIRVAFIVVMRNGDWRMLEKNILDHVERIQYVKKCPTSIRLAVNEVILPAKNEDSEDDLMEENKDGNRLEE